MNYNNDENEFKEYKKQNMAINKIKKRKGFLVLGGSFSPCHTEHVELLNEIKKHLEEYENIIIVAAYLVITTDGYVIGKLQDAAIKYEHRHKICALTASKYQYIYPSHIAHIASTSYAEKIKNKTFFPMINESEMNELITINCLGADRCSAYSINSYKYQSKTSMTVCIARKGYNEDMKERYDKAKKNGECKNFVFVSSECKPISSTLVRKYLLRLRDKLCEKDKSGKWNLRNNFNSKHGEREKQRFRNGVKEMLHSEVIEYVISNIADLWIVPKQKIVGRGQPHNKKWWMKK